MCQWEIELNWSGFGIWGEKGSNMWDLEHAYDAGLVILWCKILDQSCSKEHSSSLGKRVHFLKCWKNPITWLYRKCLDFSHPYPGIFWLLPLGASLLHCCFKKLDNTWATECQEVNTLLNFLQVNQLLLNLDGLVLFNMHMYDEFHVPDVLIVLLYMWKQNSQGYWFKQKQYYQWAISRNYTWQLYKHIHVVHHICSTCLLPLLIS